MNFSEKIIYMRKKNGMSQEDMADRLGVSRQAVSRWESGTAMPDAGNILMISRALGVTADWLLDDECGPETDISESNKNTHKETDLSRIMFYLVTLEIMAVLIQFMCVFILQNVFFAFLSFVPFIAMISGFEYAYMKRKKNETAAKFRRTFYKISAWLGLYFPVRFIISAALSLYPRPYSVLVKECIILIIYIAAAVTSNSQTDKGYTVK